MTKHLCGTRAEAQAECDRANEPLDDKSILALAALDYHMREAGAAQPFVCSFTVPGEPVPKGRPIASVRRHGKKTTVTMRTPEKTVDYESTLRLIAQANRPSNWPMRCKFRVFVDIYRTVERGDWDNYAKILDGLNPRRAKSKGKARAAVPGVLWADDGRVCGGHVEIHEVDSDPRMVVRVEALPVRCKLKGCGGAETFYPDEQGRCELCQARRKAA